MSNNLFDSIGRVIRQITKPSPEQVEAIHSGSYTLLLPYALEEVNAIRVACLIGEGKLESLPPGIRQDPKMCVLARALSNGWDSTIEGEGMTITYIGENSEQISTRLPQMVETLEQLGFTVSDYDAYPPAPTITIKNTWVTETFIQLFDQGYYPELAVDPGEEPPPLSHSAEPVVH